MKNGLYNTMRQPGWLRGLVLLSLAMLPLLAYWQYRWLGEVSVAERERMQRNLQESATQFGLEFDRELTHAYLFFQPNAAVKIVKAGEIAPSLGPENLAARYRRWNETTPHPQLVKAIYEARLNKQGAYELMRFDAATERFVASEWAGDWAALRASLHTRVQAQTRVQQVLRGVMQSRVEGTGQTIPSIVHTTINLNSMRSVDGRLPGLLIPLRVAEPGLLPASPGDYRIVLFDLTYIQQQLLPTLAQRFLLSQDARAYTCLVMKDDKPTSANTVYQSDSNFKPETFATADVNVTLFKLRLDEIDRMFMLMPQLSGLTPSSANVGQGNPRVVMGVLDTNRTRIKIEHDQTINQLSDDKVATTPLIADPMREASKAHNEGAWRLAIKHRAGSLEAAVNQVRRRNLVVSFGIVLLLGLSVGLMILASRRAQALAVRQMEFVAGVSHELRTPLAVICSAAENLADGVVANPAQTQQYGTLIRDEGRRLGSMVEQVLEFAGAQSGKRTYELRPVNVSKVMDEALAALSLPLAEQGFTVEKDFPQDLPLVGADAAALSRALQNLLTNAMKYSGASRWIGLRVVVQKQELQLIVQDRGIGIPAHELPHLGEAFYRGKEVVAAQIHGNGLGLSLVNHIAQAHGGRLSIASQVGQGSTFTLHLPVPQNATMPSLVEEPLQKMEAQ